MVKNPWRFYIPVIAACFFVFLGVLLVTTPLTRYAYGQSYRLQIDAFLSGRLALQDHPFFRVHDWVWGRGSYYQLWGLGTPVLQMPWELLARLFGLPGMPERIIFVIYYALCLPLFMAGIQSGRRPAGSAGTAIMFQNSLWLAAIALAPPFMALVYTRFGEYEEAIAFGCLWALALLSLLQLFQARPTGKFFALISFLSGLAVFVRPTMLSYGAVTFGLACLEKMRREKGSWKSILGGLLLFAAGPALLLVLNYTRFGSPFEFGYSLNLSSILVNEFALRFDYPFRKEPLLTAARELFSELFLQPDFNKFKFFKQGFFFWQSPSLRFREFYFHTFDLIAFLCTALAVPAALLDWRQTRRNNPLPDFRAAGTLAAWSAINFIILFGFYLRSPGVSSRYDLDFFPAISAGIIAFGISSSRLICARAGEKAFLRYSCVLAALIVLWYASYFLKSEAIPSEIKQRVGLTTQETKLIMAERTMARTRTFPEVPGSYECPSSTDVSSDLAYHPLGWQVDNDCQVDAITAVFMEASPCVELRVHRTQEGAEMDAIRVKSNITEMLKMDQREDGDQQVLLFCSDSIEKERPYPRLISIGWIAPENLGRAVPQLKLLAVKALPYSPPKA